MGIIITHRKAIYQNYPLLRTKEALAKFSVITGRVDIDGDGNAQTYSEKRGLRIVDGGCGSKGKFVDRFVFLFCVEHGREC